MISACLWLWQGAEASGTAGATFDLLLLLFPVDESQDAQADVTGAEWIHLYCYVPLQTEDTLSHSTTRNDLAKSVDIFLSKQAC
jgi:hypothetical protein